MSSQVKMLLHVSYLQQHRLQEKTKQAELKFRLLLDFFGNFKEFKITTVRHGSNWRINYVSMP